MGELVDSLQAALVARGATFSFGTPVDRIDRSVPTVICTNAPVAGRLLAPHAPSLAAAIARIRMVSILIVTAFFEPHADDWRGFGILFPRSSGVSALGVLCNTDMFPDRGALRSETWIYGDLSPATLPTAVNVLDKLAADRKIVTGRTDRPVASHVTPQIGALPVYDAAVLEAQAALAALPPGLAIAGNYLGKLGVSRLLDGAAEAAQAVIASSWK